MSETKNAWDDVTADDVLEMIESDDGSCDSWGYACDWLTAKTGVDCDGSYTVESIKKAVRECDPDLLEEC